MDYPRAISKDPAAEDTPRLRGRPLNNKALTLMCWEGTVVSRMAETPSIVQGVVSGRGSRKGALNEGGGNQFGAEGLHCDT